MKYIQNYKKFEGLGSWIRGKIHSDEKTAEAILISMDKLSQHDISEIERNGYIHSDGYRFTIDDFNIEIIKYSHFVPGPEGGGGTRISYSIEIDNTIFKCSNNISKKIYKKAEHIFKTIQREETSRKEEEENYTRKDAKTHFLKKR